MARCGASYVARAHATREGTKHRQASAAAWAALILFSMYFSMPETNEAAQKKTELSRWASCRFHNFISYLHTHLAGPRLQSRCQHFDSGRMRIKPWTRARQNRGIAGSRYAQGKCAAKLQTLPARISVDASGFLRYLGCDALPPLARAY